MRRPAPQTLADIRHPGPKADNRLPHALCHATSVQIELEPGKPLVTALGSWAEAHQFESAVLDLSGLELSPFDYVMPDRAIDDRHAAWYSDTYSCLGAKLDEAVAVLGWRKGVWFAHIHAYWQDGSGHHLGHLLPPTLNTGKQTTVSGYGLQGAKFEAEEDPETEFTLYRVKRTALTDKDAATNALITTLAPFEDFQGAIETLAPKLDSNRIDILGLGSFAGAEFKKGPAMTGLISEILLRPGTEITFDREFDLPVRCVDLNGQLFEGSAKPGKCPTLVTCELLLVGDA